MRLRPSSLLATVASGSWVTAQRLRLYATLLLFAEAAAVLVLLLTTNGLHDLFGRPLGTDFGQVWIAGREALAGHPERPFDFSAHVAAQQAVFGAESGAFGWHYPPFFLGVAAFLALLPYSVALGVWLLSTLLLYVAAMGGVLRGTGIRARHVLLGALAFPAVFVNLMHGQNGFLTAGLFAAALLCLENRPVAAGVLFALLAYKPQFGLIIPVALIAGRHGRALVAAGATLALITGMSIAAFGLQTWAAFWDSLGFTRAVVLEQGIIGWDKIQSVFSAARMLGASIGQAYALQTGLCALVLAAVALLWRADADFRLKAAALLCAALLTTPYCIDYDMVLLGPALAFLAARGLETGFRPGEKTLLVLVAATPLVARLVAKATLIPLGPIMMIALFCLVLARAAPARTRSPQATSAPA